MTFEIQLGLCLPLDKNNFSSVPSAVAVSATNDDDEEQMEEE